MPAKYDLTVWRGGDHRWQLQLLDAASNPIDVTDAILGTGGPVPFTVEVISAVDGRIDLVLGRDAVLPEEAHARWDLWWSDPPNRRPLIVGGVEIRVGLAHG